MGLIIGRHYVVARKLMKVERNTQIVVKDETLRFHFDNIPQMHDTMFRWKETFRNWSDLNKDFEYRFTYKILRYNIWL